MHWNRYRIGMIPMLLALLFTVAAARADVKLPALISDGMVLQQGTKVTIWGAAEPGERVTVTLKDQEASAVADADGQWKVRMGPLSAGGPFTLTIKGKNTLTVHDVLVGEVWVCSGQSNMGMTVKSVNNAPDEIAHADYPNLRLFTVEHAVAEKPQREAKGYWVPTRPDTISGFFRCRLFLWPRLAAGLERARRAHQ